MDYDMERHGMVAFLMDSFGMESSQEGMEDGEGNGMEWNGIWLLLLTSMKMKTIWIEKDCMACMIWMWRACKILGLKVSME
jgi:hypothetical protein